ncbi:MAG: hypothetical protein D6768_14630 [Chloroflexi bacterium]|nr:MAG: hypothetical protein D6768_14630 [Chloroflexota bacterium]
MKYMRLIIIAFLVGFTIFFNIERLDLAHQNEIDLDSVVYVLGFLAGLLILGIPAFSRVRLPVHIAGWAAIYVAVKSTLFLFFEGRPLLGGIYTYLSVTELSLLLISIWLAHKLAHAVQDFEDAVETVTFAGSDHHIRAISEANEAIQTEMFRSRHNHHPLSVIVIEPDAVSIRSSLHRLVREAQQSMMNHYITNNLAMLLNQQLRRSDMVLEQRDANRVVLVCPDTNKTDSEVLVEYIGDVVSRQMGLNIKCGTASFPQEALTFEELVERAGQAVTQFDPLPELPPAAQPKNGKVKVAGHSPAA